MPAQTFTVSGMTCGHCAESVSEELSVLPGVTQVEVAVESGRVTVLSDNGLTEQVATAAIGEAGYVIAEWPSTN